MKTLYILIFVSFLFFSLGGAAQGGGDGKLNRYAHCNVYTDLACFGIVSGDLVEMEIPIDFARYRVELSFGGVIEAYVGYNPAKIEESATKTSSSCIEGFVVCNLYKIDDETYRFRLRKTDDGEFFDAYLFKVSQMNQAPFIDFLSNFYPCSVSGKGLDCGKRAIFDRLNF